MRISDWSSDVCSSDLTASIFRPYVQSPQMESTRKRVRARFPRHRHDPGQPFPVECAPYPRTAGGMCHQRTGADPLVNRQLPDDLRARQRSEEHTSELQSLMRISYAVFCLKKKKHKK